MEFFDEVANFCRCKDRMDNASYEKGIDRIISEYDWRIIKEDSDIYRFGHPDYSLIKDNERKFKEIMKALKDKYGIKLEK